MIECLKVIFKSLSKKLQLFKKESHVNYFISICSNTRKWLKLAAKDQKASIFITAFALRFLCNYCQ